jgi:hypothetical protein
MPNHLLTVNYDDDTVQAPMSEWTAGTSRAISGPVATLGTRATRGF